MSALRLRERLASSRFFQGEKATAGPILLNQRRVFILPNRRGWGLALVLLIQLLAATNYSNNLAFVLSFLMVSIALLGILYGFRNLAGLEVGAVRGDPVFSGEAAAFEICLSNSGRFPRIAVCIETADDEHRMTDVLPFTNAGVRLHVPAKHRGWQQLPTVTLSSTFPLGLFRTWSPLNLSARVLVYPRPAQPGMPFPEQPGRAGALRTDADDFRGFQSYQPGDPLRRIHWKGVAKGQGVHVKEYEDGRNSELLLDFVRTPGPTEARLSQLCRWILEAEQSGLSYGLRLPHLAIASSMGPAHRRRCLEALALFPS